MAVDYADIATAVEATGMVARGGFLADDHDAVPALADGRPTDAVVVIGNVGGTIWAHFRAGETPGHDPLDRWTRSMLQPIARRYGAGFVHPSDEPFQPFQRWARRAADVWPSPIGLLVHADHGLWHAYRGALLFAEPVTGLPQTGVTSSPCLTCDDQPCLSTCPVDAFGPGTYDVDACARHVAGGTEPRCMQRGCAARLACPIGVGHRYGSDQMRFHMRAFVGAHG